MKRLEDVRIGRTWYIVDHELTSTREVDETDLVISPAEVRMRLERLREQAREKWIPEDCVRFQVGTEAYKQHLQRRQRDRDRDRRRIAKANWKEIDHFRP